MHTVLGAILPKFWGLYILVFITVVYMYMYIHYILLLAVACDLLLVCIIVYSRITLHVLENCQYSIMYFPLLVYMCILCVYCTHS
jgi:hypothetical protein